MTPSSTDAAPVQNAGIRDAGGLKRIQLPGVSDGTDPPGSLSILVLQSGRPRIKEPVMRQTAPSGLTSDGPAEPFGRDPQFCSSSRPISEMLSTGRAQVPFRQR